MIEFSPVEKRTISELTAFKTCFPDFFLSYLKFHNLRTSPGVKSMLVPLDQIYVLNAKLELLRSFVYIQLKPEEYILPIGINEMEKNQIWVLLISDRLLKSIKSLENEEKAKIMTILIQCCYYKREVYKVDGEMSTSTEFLSRNGITFIEHFGLTPKYFELIRKELTNESQTAELLIKLLNITGLEYSVPQIVSEFISI